MANPRRSQRELREAQNAIRREDMERAIAEGRRLVRKMTPQERQQSYGRRLTRPNQAAAVTRT
jgi:hypothetical protein